MVPRARHHDVRVLMLGWEFPPYITGGLGTACYGLTKALDRKGTKVLFVLPRSVDTGESSHVALLTPGRGVRRNGRNEDRATERANGDAPESDMAAHTPAADAVGGDFSTVSFRSVPSAIVSPYPVPDRPTSFADLHAAMSIPVPGSPQRPSEAAQGTVDPTTPSEKNESVPEVDSHGDYVMQTQRYADLCERLVRDESFDVIHAHDWLTFPAAMRIAATTGKPLIAHVHSTEYDRAGEHGNPQIIDIERAGMHSADIVLCVSYLTRNTILHRFDVPLDRVRVCYNGIDSNGSAAPREPIHRNDRIVLFLGRITMQKGPEYFMAAAKKVMEKVENVKFVMAGSGDMIERVIRQAAELGIAHKVVFTGFLNGPDVERVFRMADVYVMPSVSEPFGITPLEAISHDVPVIISRNSGVAEVLRHVLKVDFWDVNDIADKIVAVLRHPPLSQTLRKEADIEVRRLTWDDAAACCVRAYQDAIAAAV